MRRAVTLALALFVAGSSPASANPDPDPAAAFEQHSGTRLVFDRAALPEGRYYDRMPALSSARQRAAATILLREVKKYPQGYLGRMGLDAIGVFEACVSKRGDGFRPYNRSYDGYLYYGVWNGQDGVAACYYSDTQLPLTFHHEVFHHVDGTSDGRTSHDTHFASDDARFRRAVNGSERYPAPTLTRADLRALRAIAAGDPLTDAVSEYAKKSAGEDQAETARHFMTTLADSLVQVVERPELAGSQRILHLLTQYEEAAPGGPDVDWFVDVALGRSARRSPVSRLEAIAATRLTAASVTEARALLQALADGQIHALPPADRDRALAVAAMLTPQLIRFRTRARNDDTAFTVWTGRAYNGGGNSVLREDIRMVAQDAARLDAIADAAGSARATDVTRAQLKTLRLLARYYVYIDDKWSVTPGTRSVFEDARRVIAQSLPASARQLGTADFPVLARAISIDGRAAEALGRRRAEPQRRDNPHLRKVDAAIASPRIRREIRAVQPAVVRLGNGTGVNISASGLILTNAHVAKTVGASKWARFPDDARFKGEVIAVDATLDLALIRLAGASSLPAAPISRARPRRGDFVAVIGQPGTRTPSGEATGYEPFHVSTGKIRGFLPNPLGSQSLGRTKHDAWTYWGHSGSPLFNADGAIVALHNTWDSTTAMRHAVPWEAIRHFLRAHHVAFSER